MIRALLLPGEAAESGVVVAVGDAAGRLLWVEGDHHIRTLTGDMGFIAGANWSEGAVGTSAPGTSLALDRSVQIRGAEHFNRLVQPWSCTAVPVHDPESRRILGVIDVTGGDDVITPQAQLLVDATARAIEGELLVARLRARAEQPASRRPTHRGGAKAPAERVTLRVLGRDRALLEVAREGSETISELGQRHAELLLMLATHRQGVSADQLGELVYGDGDAVGTVTLRAEMVRLRKVLEKTAPALVPESRPYRLAAELETDAQQVLSLLDRGAHRVALAAYRGDVLPDSTAPGRGAAARHGPHRSARGAHRRSQRRRTAHLRRDGCRRRRRGTAAALPRRCSRRVRPSGPRWCRASSASKPPPDLTPRRWLRRRSGARSAPSRCASRAEMHHLAP